MPPRSDLFYFTLCASQAQKTNPAAVTKQGRGVFLLSIEQPRGHIQQGGNRNPPLWPSFLPFLPKETGPHAAALGRAGPFYRRSRTSATPAMGLG